MRVLAASGSIVGHNSWANDPVDIVPDSIFVDRASGASSCIDGLGPIELNLIDFQESATN